MATWSTYADRALAKDGPPRPASALTAWTTSASPAYCRDLAGRLLAANVSYALARPDIAPGFRAEIKRIMGDLNGG